MRGGSATVGTRTRIACAILAAATASAVLRGAAPVPAPAGQSAPAPASALREITGEGSFRAAFDSAASAPRLVLLLSPT